MMEYALIFLLGLATAAVATLGVQRLVSFRAQRSEDYATTGPDFDIRDVLNGPLLCEGVIYGPMGRVSARFVAEMNATWEGDTGSMTEEFRYDTGTVLHREWTLTVGEGGHIVATAPDIIGQGHGQQTGAGVRLNYAIRLPESSGGHVVQAVDWMYLMENGAIINRSEFRKFGIRVAELVATMRPMQMVQSEAAKMAAE